MEQSYITRPECVANHNKIMEEFKHVNEKIENIRIDLAKLPEKLIEKLDDKYAGKFLEGEVKKIKDQQEQRIYDWVKYLVMTIVGVAIGFLIK